MAFISTSFPWKKYLFRLLLAFILVFVTYNPIYAYFHWAIQDLSTFTTFKALVGMTILIGWLVFIRYSMRALGRFGVAVALVFFVLLFAWILGWESLADSPMLVQYVALFILTFLLGTGVSWQIIVMWLSGQRDIHDLDS
ncbi:MAG: hypothetical protein GY862_30135 [Gammaproteobacteria bacterium]|nr:hypothetical protein [Gammaproteobacteria bacterium]